MPAKPAAQRRSDCPLNATLEAFGDRWSLLVVRDLMLLGRRTFREFLESGEGIATNILSDRLQRLEAQGIVEKRPDPADARKVLYRLTAKGLDLAPILVEMIVWGARYHDTAAPPSQIRAMTRHRERFLAEVRKRWAEAGRS